MKLSSLVAEATVLSRNIKSDTARLDELKTQIRDAATKLRAKTGDDKVEFESPQGTCTVSFPQDRLTVTGAPETIADSMPPELWTKLFVSKTVLAEGAREAMATLGVKMARLVAKVVDTTPATPVVTLAK